MDTVRVGIIGVGNMGTNHAKNIFGGKIAGMKLCGLCDTDEAKRERLKEMFPGVPVFSDHHEMFVMGCCDAVIVSTPHYSHSIIATEAIQAGLHVMVEKPIGVFARQAETLNRVAAESDKVFVIMFNQRTSPIYTEARRIVKSGELGVLKRLTWIITNWYRTQAYYDSGSWRATWRGEGGGVLLNQAPHNLDLWQWIFGMPQRIKAVCNVARYHNIEVEDDATIFAEYDNGASATFITSTGEFPGTNRLEIVGDLGKMVIEDGKIKRWRLERPETEVRFSSGEGFARIPYKYEEFKPEDDVDGHCAILQNFTNSILYGEPLLSPGTDGVNELEISNAAYLSAWKDKWIDLPCDRREFEKALEQRRADSTVKNVNAHSTGEENCSDRWKIKW